MSGVCGVVIHYHGTPITPRSVLLTLAGRCFCVSYAAPNDLKTCMQIGQSVLLDNGAFSAWTRGYMPNWDAYYDWVEPHLSPVHWAIVPDRIDGSVEDNLILANRWPHRREWAGMVWHMHEPLDHLARLSDAWPRVCFGSSGEFANPCADAWHQRIDAAWNMLERTRRRPWVHMLRAAQQACDGPWPFASCDSTNVGRNHASSDRSAPTMAAAIDAKNPGVRWLVRPEQMEFVA